MVRFKKIVIDKDSTFETAAACDVNNDGIIDIVCGGYWYKGPDFKKKIKICDVKETSSEGGLEPYWDDFMTLPLDVDGDGYIDLVTGSWSFGNLRWRKNPRNEGTWEEIMIDDKAMCVETGFLVDIDRCGVPELIANNVRQSLLVYKLITDKNGKGTGKFRKCPIKTYPIYRDQGHGIGFADIGGRGRLDIVTQHGWYQQPNDPYNDEWLYFPEFELGCYASIPVVGMKIAGSGYMDLVYGVGHGYGLHWLEQVRDDFENSHWVKHVIDDAASQYHSLVLADLDGDGEDELVTGKRYKAHGLHDPGSLDPLGVYYYKRDKGRLVRHVIDFGDPSDCCGAGLGLFVGNVTGSGRPDILAPGKDGLALYVNLG